MTLRNEETCQQLDPASTGLASTQLNSAQLDSAQLAAHYAKSKQSRAEENPFWPCLPSCNSTQRYSEETLQQLLGWPFVGFCFVLIRERGTSGGRARVTNLVLSSLSASRHLYNSLSCTFFMLFL